MANFMNSSNRAQAMVSSHATNQNQGGGDKKAGFPYIVGRGQWTNIAFYYNSPPLKTLQFTVNPNVRQSRPVYLRPSSYPTMF